MKRLTVAGNTLVPAILALESSGFVVSVEDAETFKATRGDEVLVAGSPEALLGLVKLVELRTWSWQATDDEIEAVASRFSLDGSAPHSGQ